MEITILADSCCDVIPKWRDSIGLSLVPLKIAIDGTTQYVDDDTIDTKQLLADMKATKQPIITSAPAPEEYAWRMRQAPGPVVVVTLSSKLSGSYNSAIAAMQMVQEETPDKQIAVFDSKSASAGETRIVLQIENMRRHGAGFEEICREIPRFIDGMRTFFVLDDLRTLIKNGRIPKMKGMLATVLMFRPIMGENGNGEIVQVENQRGSAKALDRLVQIVAERTAQHEPQSLVLTLSFCGRPERALRLKKSFCEKCPAIRRVVVQPTSGLSTTYANDGGIVVAYG